MSIAELIPGVEKMLKQHFPPTVASLGTKGILIGFIIGVPAWALGEFFGMIHAATLINVPDILFDLGIVSYFVLVFSLVVWFIRGGIEARRINQHVQEKRRLLSALRNTLLEPNIPEITRRELEVFRDAVLLDLGKIERRHKGLLIQRKPLRVRVRW